MTDKRKLNEMAGRILRIDGVASESASDKKEISRLFKEADQKSAPKRISSADHTKQYGYRFGL